MYGKVHFDSLEKYKSNRKNQILVNEIIEVLVLLDKIGFKEIDIQTPYEQP
jgi:hypothetical protein